MVSSCCAINCTYRFENVSVENRRLMHRFPMSNRELLDKWIVAMRRWKWKPSKGSYICSAHFKADDYRHGQGPGKRLKPNAVPSVFIFPNHLVKKPTFRRTLEYRTEQVLSTSSSEIEISEDGFSASGSSATSDKSCQTTNSIEPASQKARKAIAALRAKNYRLRNKIQKMEDVIKALKERHLGSEELYDILDNNFAGLPLLPLLKSQLSNIKKVKKMRRYSPEIREFATTLYFYSAKGYQFLRRFMILPHKSLITKWISSIDGDPGILTDVFEYLRKNSDQPHLQNVALIFDAMAIRKQRVYDRKKGKMTGNVHLGFPTDGEQLAKEALFFQIVSYTTPFKTPVAYFLTNGLNNHLQTQLMMTVIGKLEEINISVTSVTCDGTTSNIQTLKNAGWHPDEQDFFPHPTSNKPVYVFLDACHMVKLARNALADCRVIQTPDGKVEWNYIRLLDETQQREGLKLANNLSMKHINFRNKVMNVSLAAQTLSSGVADALDYLRKIGYPGFEGSEATVAFLRIIDRCFDVLNSRNPFGKGFKRPIQPSNMEHFEKIVQETTEYLSNLKIAGQPLLFHRRKTFALGFITSLRSMLPLAKCLFHHGLKYFMTYKVSQDHIELLFNCIRSLQGSNDNPNALQLKWAVQKMQLRNYVAPTTTGNCRQLEEENGNGILFASSSKKKDKEEKEDDVTLLSFSSPLSDLSRNILTYIAGYLVKRLLTNIECQECKDLLTGNNLKTSVELDHNYSCLDGRFDKSFQRSVNRGGLCFSSDWVNTIVRETEKAMKEGCRSRKQILMRIAESNLDQGVRHTIVTSFEEDLHETQLVKRLCIMYFDLKMRADAQRENISNQRGTTIRQKYKKLILFKNV